MGHIQIRIDDEDKKNAQETLAKMGLSLSSGIKLFLKKVVEEEALPFEITAAKKRPVTLESKVTTSPIPAPEPSMDFVKQELPKPEVIMVNPFEKKKIG